MNTLGLDVDGTAATSSEPQPSGSVEWAPNPTAQWGQALEDNEGNGNDWTIAPSTQWGEDAANGGDSPDAPTTAKLGDKSKKEQVWPTAPSTGWGDAGNNEDLPEAPTLAKHEDKSRKEKGKPYVPATPTARVKMTPEELAERMEKIRLQNEKIKERREYVKADEEAFNTSVAADRAKQAANRKVQAQINQNREHNAKKKLEKIGNREWDSGKQGGEWKQGKRPTEDKGRGNSFSGAFVNRDIGGPPNNRSSRKGSLLDATEPKEHTLGETTPHTAKPRVETSHIDSHSGKPKSSENHST